ncbi:Hypothetical protein SMAX5B_016406 [Scophthalmus maximus]|uniref:Uncharacterized protein n=1 Tax=Scophthalmus maximus TaxID=52904 RepID=A0A2U9C0Z3_SCOMX|nr:Hypothetical protein SMAX5B_016406 [Scophthalmus maximus]
MGERQEKEADAEMMEGKVEERVVVRDVKIEKFLVPSDRDAFAHESLKHEMKQVKLRDAV